MGTELQFPTCSKTITDSDGVIVGWLSYDETAEGNYYGGVFILHDYRGKGHGSNTLAMLRESLTKPLQLVGEYHVAFLSKAGCKPNNGSWWVYPEKRR